MLLRQAVDERLEVLAPGVRQAQLLRDLHMLPREIDLRHNMLYTDTSGSAAGCGHRWPDQQARRRTPVLGERWARIEHVQVMITLRSALLMVIARGVAPATALRQQASTATVRPTYDPRMFSQPWRRGGRCRYAGGVDMVVTKTVSIYQSAGQAPSAPCGIMPVTCSRRSARARVRRLERQY